MKKIFFLSSVVFLLMLTMYSCNESEIANKPKTYGERYKEIENNITKNPEWLASIQQKAKEKNIPVDSMMKLDIQWMLDEQDGKHKPGTQPVVTDTATKKLYEERVKEMIEKIKSDKDWMAAIKKKATERKISVDSMLLLDARWSVDDQDGKHKQ